MEADMQKPTGPAATKAALCGRTGSSGTVRRETGGRRAFTEVIGKLRLVRPPPIRDEYSVLLWFGRVSLLGVQTKHVARQSVRTVKAMEAWGKSANAKDSNEEEVRKL